MNQGRGQWKWSVWQILIHCFMDSFHNMPEPALITPQVMMSHWKSALGGHLWDTLVSPDHTATTLCAHGMPPWRHRVSCKSHGGHSWMVEGPVLGLGLRTSPETPQSPGSRSNAQSPSGSSSNPPESTRPEAKSML